MPEEDLEALIEVAPDASEALRNRVFALRYAVYGRELQFPLNYDCGRLMDLQDDYSVNLLLVRDGKDVGTLRVTDDRHGELEFAVQCARWRELAHQLRQDGKNLAEWTRLMVLKEYRGASVTRELFDAALRCCREMAVDTAILAGKAGKHARYYRRFGARVLDPIPHEYWINGHNFGASFMMGIEISPSN